MVKDIHQRLVSSMTMDIGLENYFVTLAEEHAANVVMSLLHCAPSCDRAAALMWRTIGSSGLAVQEVLAALLSVMEDGMFFSREDNEAIFALAATVVLWVMIRVPEWHTAILLHSTYLFAVQTMKTLFCQLGRDKKLVALEHKWVWDTMLCADTQHYAVGLLAREMRRSLRPLCSCIAEHLLSLLIWKQPRWDLPALAFFVEVLECLDLSKHGHGALLVMSSCLGTGLWALMQLSGVAGPGRCWCCSPPGFHSTALCCTQSGGICSLCHLLVEQLADPDGEMVGMTLSVLTHMLQEKDLKISSATALKLTESLLPHFENDNSHVQLLSIQLFRKVMELVVEEGKKALTRTVNQSLLPLFLRWHDENQRVAEVRFCVSCCIPGRGLGCLLPWPCTGTRVPCPALRCHLRLSAAPQASRETLLCAARFLSRRDLEEPLTQERRMNFAERLLLEDESRAAEHLRWALPCLQNPQQRLRRAAVRFIGARAEPCRGTRPCGRRAGSARGGQLCRWGRHGLCVARTRRNAPAGTEGGAPGPQRGPSSPEGRREPLLLEPVHPADVRRKMCRTSAGSGGPVFFGDLWFPLKMGPAGAPGTARAGHS
ncbi:maestro heat-like repeat-containing protein family member 7 [Acridotheres tristis]